ncbi:MAG TPA: GGDEF and EAL domain-containing protein [Terriglobales bacterium]
MDHFSFLVNASPSAAAFPTALERWYGLLAAAFAALFAFQQLRFHRLRRYWEDREELFRIVTENAADMIALVDIKGRRLYNSPAYYTGLGYTPAELAATGALEQIHPEDRFKVLDAAREARDTGIGKKLEYRIRHKNGTWHILESTASAIRDANGEVAKLVIVNRDITQRKHTEELLEHNSFHDAVTGLPNRRLFLDRLHGAEARAQRMAEFRYAVMLVDLDDFRSINGLFGAATADQVLLETGRRMASCLRHGDTVARPKGKLPIPDALLSRLGGDEFAILVEGLKDTSDALRVAQRIQSALGMVHAFEEREVHVTASVGIALSTDAHSRTDELLQEADFALRRAQSLGKSRVEFFDETLHNRAVSRLKLEADLRTALNYRQFEICYQPVMELETAEVVGLEALVRWKHPEQGDIPPSRFVEVAESAGLMIPIGRWVLHEAAKQLCCWRPGSGALGAAWNLTVNLSARQFHCPTLVSDTEAILQEVSLDPSRLQFEVAEAVAMASPKLTSGVMAQLKQLGVRISVGDFGAGSSSLSWMRRLPIDEIKIDRAIVGSMPTDRASCEIVRLIVVMGRELNVKVLAEGIESFMHLEQLKRTGCQFGQGFFFSAPVPAEELEQMVHTPKPTK